MRNDVLCPGCGRAASHRTLTPLHDLGKQCTVRHCTHTFHDAADELVYAAKSIAGRAENLVPYPAWGFGGGSQLEMKAQDRWVMENSALLLDSLRAMREFAARSASGSAERKETP